jgi:hypothetical protein
MSQMATHLAHPLPAHRPSVARVRDALRERRLRPQARARLAATYERLVIEPPVRRPPRITAKVPVQRAAVRAAELELLDIAARLRAEPAPRPEGVQAAHHLVTDGAGPLYAPAERDRLQRVARSVLEQL